MAVDITIKKSVTAGEEPTQNNLQVGELAVNTVDGKLWVGDSAGNPFLLSNGGGGTPPGTTTGELLKWNGSLWEPNKYITITNTFAKIGNRSTPGSEGGELQFAAGNNDSAWVLDVRDKGSETGATTSELRLFSYVNTSGRILIGLPGQNNINSDIILSAGGAEVMRARDNGRVGIGLSSPLTKLHVYESGITSPVRFGNQQVVTAYTEYDFEQSGVRQFRITTGPIVSLIGEGSLEEIRITAAGSGTFIQVKGGASHHTDFYQNSFKVLSLKQNTTELNNILIIGPQRNSTTEGAQIELKAPDKNPSYIIDLVGTNPATAGTSNLRIRPVGTNTAGIIIGGEGGGNSGSFFRVHTGGATTARFKIDSTGKIFGLFTGTGVTQPDSKFEVVSALPNNADTNTIYFVV